MEGKSYRSKYSAKFVLLLKEYWLEIDDDADGRVSKKEFVNGWEKKRQNASPGI